MTENRKELPKHRRRRLAGSVLILVGITLTAVSIACGVLIDYQILLQVQANPYSGHLIIDPAYPLVPFLLGVMLVLVGWRTLPRRFETWPGD